MPRAVSSSRCHLHDPVSCNRLQEDPWNSISAGALTGGFLQLRTGARSAAKSAAFGGVLLVGDAVRICACLMRTTENLHGASEASHLIMRMPSLMVLTEI